MEIDFSLISTPVGGVKSMGSGDRIIGSWEFKSAGKWRHVTIKLGFISFVKMRPANMF